MTKRIKVIVPYLSGGKEKEGILMYIHVQDQPESDKNPILKTPIPQQIKDNPKIKNILGVEIFTELVPVENESEAHKTLSLVLPTISKDSNIDAEKPKSGERSWKFQRETDGQVIPFSPHLDLTVTTRCPLGWASVEWREKYPPEFEKQEDEMKLLILQLQKPKRRRRATTGE